MAMRVEVLDASPLLDAAPPLRIVDAVPRRPVAVEVSCAYGPPFGTWSARGEVVADDVGVVDLSDPRWWWQAERSAGSRPGDSTSLVPTTVVAGAASAKLVRRRRLEGIRVFRLQEDSDGLTGVLALPPEEMPIRGAAVIVGGSEGGIGLNGATVQMWAAHGVAGFALAYWNAPGLPESLADIEVERVGRAADRLMAALPDYRGEVCVVGLSRGSELALLAAAHLEEVSHAVSIAGSGRAWNGIGPTGDHQGPAWRLKGRGIEPGIPIEVERIPGRLLMLTGSDDQLWPSAELTAEAVLRREGAGRPVDLVVYDGAGHALFAPRGVPVPAPDPPGLTHPVTRKPIRLGGTKTANARAQWDAWDRVITAVTTR